MKKIILSILLLGTLFGGIEMLSNGVVVCYPSSLNGVVLDKGIPHLKLILITVPIIHLLVTNLIKP